jgi:hypothetical protein
MRLAEPVRSDNHVKLPAPRPQFWITARDLSGQFEVMFRTFGQKVFSRPDMEMLERTLNVAKAEI